MVLSYGPRKQFGKENQMTTKKWDGFKLFLNSFFRKTIVADRLSGNGLLSMFWGSAFIDDVRTCDAGLADKMQKVQDAYTEMYEYVSSKQNDSREII
jgi:hypothetical protein